MLNAIIIDAKKINFENADIFFVNKEQFNKICALYLSAESLFLNDKDNDKLTVNTNRRGTIKKKKSRKQKRKNINIFKGSEKSGSCFF